MAVDFYSKPPNACISPANRPPVSVNKNKKDHVNVILLFAGLTGFVLIIFAGLNLYTFQRRLLARFYIDARLGY
jgi:hypothetical protein